MKITKLLTGHIPTNTYILTNEKTNEAVIIDGGETAEPVLSYCTLHGIKPVAMLLTHAHFDHAASAKKMREAGVKVYISEIEEPHLRLSEYNLSTRFHFPMEPAFADETFLDGDTFTVAGLTFTAWLTPGHSAGSASFFCEDALFSGDTLFLETVGRYDVPDGSGETLRASVKRLLSSSFTGTVYPGHGSETTLSHEREYNPFR